MQLCVSRGARSHVSHLHFLIGELELKHFVVSCSCGVEYLPGRHGYR
jgi:hypothetical protein